MEERRSTGQIRHVRAGAQRQVRALELEADQSERLVDLLAGDVLQRRSVSLATAPFTDAGLAGPDLVRPRPHLRIVPSKVSGEPHLEHSRITTLTLAALARRGYSVKRIAVMYDEPEEVVAEALDLERQLAARRPTAA